ncbi:MAG: ZIP family metal transporter [Candidatus Berkelbacteria bacterium]
MNYLIIVVTIISTFLGGLFAIRFRDKLHLILGFSAGAVIGVTFFDLLPESINLTAGFYPTQTITLLIVIGFILYLIVDRFFSIHSHEDDHCENPNHQNKLGAFTLCVHSFLDGLGIGLAFKVSPTVGWIVAAAVLTHDFSDGINTVNMILKNKNNKKEAYKWLIIDALAPALGITTAIFLTVSQPVLGLILSVFTGLFLYIGASELIPESHHRHPTIWTTVMTVLGVSTLYLIINFIK